MKKKDMRTLMTFALAAMAVTAWPESRHRVYIDAASKGADIPESMYGMFFEEINHAGDGGLYGELLQNRSFEEHVCPGGMTYKDGKVWAPHALNYWGLDYVDFNVDWNIEEKKFQGWDITATGCSLSKDVAVPEVVLHENTPNALRLAISGASDASVVNVDNSGYWGLAVKKGATYKLRFYLRTEDYTGGVKAMICNAGGMALTEKEFKVVSDGKWTEYTAELVSTSKMDNGLFRLQFSGNGSIDVDYVSLFPADTYKGRENGFRKDVAEMLEGLNPAFLRWPGGCIVEGATLGNRVKWKETIGDPMTRPGEWSLWGYRNSYGFGYHEFLQLCEDMDMDGMFVANVGMSCSNRNGDFVEADDTEGLQPYLQEIRDAIEYAIGDPSSNEWAAKRAEAGHPEPFPLKYVELGNENGSDRYVQRYAYFYNTLKAEYPDITFINTMHWNDRSLFEKTDMFDVHWYVTPDEFYADATLFDVVERGDYTVYAGEYAANNNVGSGNMDAALSEAVFAGGMERNSDLVTMTSYAPLLTHVNAPNWACNLIWFDNDEVMGRASYHVQKLYAENCPDYNVNTRIQSNLQQMRTRGRIGVGTWNTQAEFRNVTVCSHDGEEVFYESDFTTRVNDWTESTGTWSVDDGGAYVQTSSEMPCISLMNAMSVGNCTVELEARKTGGAEGFLIVFGADTLETTDYYRLNIGGWANTLVGLEKVTNGGGGTLVSGQSPCTIETGKWYKIKLVLREAGTMECYIDGEKVFDYDFLDILPGRVQAFGGYDRENGEVVVKVVNATDSLMTTTFNLNAAHIKPEGKVVTLAAESLTDENSLANPKRIYPEETTFGSFASEFVYDIQPRSLTIMRIKADVTGVSPMEIPAYDYSDEPISLYEPVRLRQQACDELETLITYAEQSHVGGAKESERLTESIGQSKDLLADPTATTKSLNAQYESLDEMLTRYFKAQMTEEGNCTDKIKNADFVLMSTDGWLGNAPSLESNVGEFFNCDFDMYQMLTGLEDGYYLVCVQGFYRNGAADVAYEKNARGTEELKAMLYGNSAEVPLQSLYDDGEGFGSYNNFCDNRTQAESAFNHSEDTYVNYLVTEVTGGRLRLGLRKTSKVDLDWTCFNNFRLYRLPLDEVSIRETMKDKAEPDAAYDLSGRKWDIDDIGNRKGIYIIGNKKKVIR